jgi:hypothetical protein
LRDVHLCHCTECRRWAGHVWAATEAAFADLDFSEERGLRWIDSPDSMWDARRGFCSECGSSLFWQVPGSDRVSLAAGCLEGATGLETTEQIWVRSAGDYYELDERIPSHERGGGDG